MAEEIKEIVKKVVSDFEIGIDIPALAERYNLTVAEVEEIIYKTQYDYLSE